MWPPGSLLLPEASRGGLVDTTLPAPPQPPRALRQPPGDSEVHRLEGLRVFPSRSLGIHFSLINYQNPPVSYFYPFSSAPPAHPYVDVGRSSYPWQGDWDEMSFKVPPNPKHPVITEWCHTAGSGSSSWWLPSGVGVGHIRHSPGELCHHLWLQPLVCSPVLRAALKPAAAFLHGTIPDLRAGPDTRPGPLLTSDVTAAGQGQGPNKAQLSSPPTESKS